MTYKNKNGSGSYSFSQSNYNAGKCGQGHNLKGDIPQGNATYDAARANMGEPWMMPTKDQYQELIDNTTSEWTSINRGIYIIYGRKFTSKTDISKYIFLPAAGMWENASISSATNTGQYWTSAYSSSATGWSLHLDDSGILAMTDFNRYRYKGYSIRPVRPLEW